jgi:hypothetical protein
MTFYYLLIGIAPLSSIALTFLIFACGIISRSLVPGLTVFFSFKALLTNKALAVCKFSLPLENAFLISGTIFLKAYSVI